LKGFYYTSEGLNYAEKG